LDHCINGRSLFPATGHLYTAWQVIGLDKIVQFNSFEICQAIVLDVISEPKVAFNVIVAENKITIMNKSLVVARMNFKIVNHFPIMATDNGTDNEINFVDIYNEFNRYGYEYKEEFKLIQSKNSKIGHLSATPHIIAYMDCVLQMCLDNITGLLLPTLLRKVISFVHFSVW